MALDHALHLAVERIPWGTLEHAYGPANDTPEALAVLASESEEEPGRSDVRFWSAATSFKSASVPGVLLVSSVVSFGSPASSDNPAPVTLMP